MIKIPLQDIIEKIKKDADISEDEINNKIDEKMKQLSGLISKEGAAHIIANELGIKLLEDVSGKLQIKNILAGMRDVEAVGKVQRKFPVREFNSKGREGKVGSLIMADETGSIRVVLWGDQTDNLQNIKDNETIKILGAYVRDNNAQKEIHMNDRSQLIINPPGENVGEVKKLTSERKKINELTEKDSFVEVMGTIVQVFDLRFYEVCPKCNKRAKPLEGAFNCAEHGSVDPSYSYVLNLILDDGTDNIRSVFFRNQVENLLKLNHEKLLQFKEKPENFDETKNNLLGTMLKITGRVNKNDFFDRLEIVANAVTQANPDEEIKRLNEEVSKVEN
jgi:replication factor A1|tara:strand:+ start:503 stop:1504 length:1002 start_codon:yes stop_codon:yes gene_type:complete